MGTGKLVALVLGGVALFMVLVVVILMMSGGLVAPPSAQAGRNVNARRPLSAAEKSEIASQLNRANAQASALEDELFRASLQETNFQRKAAISQTISSLQDTQRLTSSMKTRVMLDQKEYQEKDIQKEIKDARTLADETEAFVKKLRVQLLR